jgi:hypothetical protein
MLRDLCWRNLSQTAAPNPHNDTGLTTARLDCFSIPLTVLGPTEADVVMASTGRVTIAQARRVHRQT